MSDPEIKKPTLLALAHAAKETPAKDEPDREVCMKISKLPQDEPDREVCIKIRKLLQIFVFWANH